MKDLELRTVYFGEPVPVAVARRADGSAQPRAVIAGVPAKDIISLIGESNFYHQNGMTHKRVDCPQEVVEEISQGHAELGIVNVVPQPLQEGVGILLTTQGNDTEISILGRVSSQINPTE